MREIAFRAWDGVTMSESFYPRTNDPDTFPAGEGIIWLQYTGLKDSKGVEIYEGDVVKLDSWEPSNMQVAFIEGAFCLANKKGEFVGDIHYIHHANTPQSEIIGNIYQNPELISSDKK